MSTVAPSASYSLTVRLGIKNRPGMLGRVASAIGEEGGDIGAVDLVESLRNEIIRDITIKVRDSVHGQQVVNRLRHVAGIRVVNVSDRTFLMHLGGKIEVRNKVPIRTRDDLSMAYTPGVARVCLAIRDDRQRAFALTIKQNMVAVVTDGTAVLGLGDIGPEAALPVMEGKAMLFKEFAGVDAFPVCLATRDVDRIVETVKTIAPGFGGINLEDIAAPRCFEVESGSARSSTSPCSTTISTARPWSSSPRCSTRCASCARICASCAWSWPAWVRRARPRSRSSSRAACATSSVSTSSGPCTAGAPRAWIT